jgi:uncharacterized protein (DUF1786 family)
MHKHHEAKSEVDGDVIRVLAVDVGAGTQDILVYDSRRTPENCFKLVLPSQTQVVGGRIRAATARGSALHLQGVLMGGGESGYAVEDHLKAGLTVSATPAAARTLHNDLERVARMGVELRESAPEHAEVIELGDIDLEAISGALELFGVQLPGIVAVAVQDHGYRPGSGNNEVRFEYLQGLIEEGGDLGSAIYHQAPAGMTRMAALLDAIPGGYVMDTGAAAVLGSLGDPVVARAVATTGAVLVNAGNMHTFATLVKGRRLFGLFEHHTSGITPRIIADLVERLRAGTIDAAAFRRDFDGHGAALHPAYREEGPFPLVAITGPNRGIARSLGYHEAAPHGDMMLTGAFGLVEGVLIQMGRR